jgi:hypothetical protein
MLRGSSVPPGIGAAKTRLYILLCEAAYSDNMPAPLNFRKSLLEIIVSSFRSIKVQNEKQLFDNMWMVQCVIAIASLAAV